MGIKKTFIVILLIAFFNVAATCTHWHDGHRDGHSKKDGRHGDGHMNTQ